MGSILNHVGANITHKKRFDKCRVSVTFSVQYGAHLVPV